MQRSRVLYFGTGSVETGSHCVALASSFLQPFLCLLHYQQGLVFGFVFFFRADVLFLVLFFSAFVLSAFKIVCVALAILELCQSTLVPNSQSPRPESCT